MRRPGDRLRAEQADGPVHRVDAGSTRGRDRRANDPQRTRSRSACRSRRRRARPTCAEHVVRRDVASTPSELAIADFGARVAVARRLDAADARVGAPWSIASSSSAMRTFSSVGSVEQLVTPQVEIGGDDAVQRRRATRARTTRRAHRTRRCRAPLATSRRSRRDRAFPPTRSPAGGRRSHARRRLRCRRSSATRPRPPNTSTSVSDVRTTYASTCSPGSAAPATRRAIANSSFVGIGALTPRCRRPSSPERAAWAARTTRERSGRSSRTCRSTSRSRCRRRRRASALRDRCRSAARRGWDA